MKCPKCFTVMKLITRKNYPFGRKSKVVITHTQTCTGCDYQLIEDKENKRKRKNTKRRSK